MGRSISFSRETLSLTETARHQSDTDSAPRLFFSEMSPFYAARFAGYSPVEVRAELRGRLAELDRTTTMGLLSAVEAAFRVDYLQRCYHRGKDDISRQWLDLYKHKGARVSLEDEIFENWKNNTTGSAKLIGELRGAFKFRHWMAHGRYWTSKLGKKYDYLSVYPIAVQAVNGFPLLAA